MQQLLSTDSFRYVIDLVRSLKPGQAITISMRELSHAVPGFRHNGADFTPADRVLENIVGSAFEYSHSTDYANRSVCFYRHCWPSETKTYISPDRR